MDKDRYFQMRVDDAFLKMLDDWRRHQPDLPTRAGAVRQLIEFGLEASILAKIGNAKASDGNDIDWADAAEALYKLIVKAHDAGAIGEDDMEEANRIFGTAWADGMLRQEQKQGKADAPPVDLKEPEVFRSGPGIRTIRGMTKKNNT